MSKKLITHRIGVVSYFCRLAASIPVLIIFATFMNSAAKLLAARNPDNFETIGDIAAFAELVVSILVFIYIVKISRNVLVYFRLRKRQKVFSNFVIEQQFTQITDTEFLRQSSLTLLGGKKISKHPANFLTMFYPHSYFTQGVFSNVLSRSGWVYADYTYDKHMYVPNNRYNEPFSYVSLSNYYSTMSTELPRELPNVFFDSIKARGRQFEVIFDGDQVTSLEGDFSKYFTVYFPYDYQIDSLSFITPEVMLAMRDAAQYDIEIVGNRLFLYGSLGDPKTQISDMSSKLMGIREQLADNIVTYRDTRVNIANSTKIVSKYGVRLQNSLRPKVISLITVFALLGLFQFFLISNGLQDACGTFVIGTDNTDIDSACINSVSIATILRNAWVVSSLFLIVALFIVLGIVREIRERQAFREHRVRSKGPQLHAPTKDSNT